MFCDCKQASKRTLVDGVLSGIGFGSEYRRMIAFDDVAFDIAETGR